jgi:hypothetical protein
MDYVHELSKLTEDKASPTSERRLTQIVSQAVCALPSCPSPYLPLPLLNVISAVIAHKHA